MLFKLPGYVTILVSGVALILYGITLDLDINWVIGLGLLLIIISIMAATLVK